MEKTLIDFGINQNGVSRKTIEKDGASFFVKEAVNPDAQIFIEREYKNQSFLFDYTGPVFVGFRFLKPNLSGNALMYPCIPQTKWLAIDAEHLRVSADAYIDQMCQFFDFCHEIPESNIPDWILGDSFTRADMQVSKAEQDADYCVSAQLLDRRDADLLLQRFITFRHIRAYQHHDVVPWHMADFDGQVFLVDAGWGAWSLWAYDIAYYMLQMIGYANRQNDARMVFDTCWEKYQHNPQYYDLLKCALAYRGLRLAAELHRQGKNKNAKKVIQVALSVSVT